MINDVVLPFYKPKMFIRNFDDLDASREGAPGPIRNMQIKNGTGDSFFIGGGKRGDKSQEKSTNKLQELEKVVENVDLTNEKLNKARDECHDARERIKKRCAGNSPDEDKSIKSKKSKGKRAKLAQVEVKTAASGGLQSANESQIHFDGFS